MKNKDKDTNTEKTVTNHQELESDSQVSEQSEETELERLERELGEACCKADEYLDGWQRSQAEFSNYRKRQEAERLQQAQLSNATLIAKILPVMDDLERAGQTLPADLHGLTWIEGVFLIQRKLQMILESEGVQPIETKGKSFDPLFHEAVTYEQIEGYEEGQIISQIQQGYTLGDRVIRPAMVRVARALEQPKKPEETPENNDESS